MMKAELPIHHAGKNRFWTRWRILVATCAAILLTTPLWLLGLMDAVRSTVEPSFTIEWGPTYFVEELMVSLYGKRGVERLCQTPKGASHPEGASNVIQGVVDPQYAPLLIAAATNADVHPLVRGSALSALCGMDHPESVPFLLRFVRDPGNGDLRSTVLSRLRDACQAWVRWRPDPNTSGSLIPEVVEPGIAVEKELQEWIASGQCDMPGECKAVLAELRPLEHGRELLLYALDVSNPLDARLKALQSWKGAEGRSEFAPLLREGLNAVKRNGSPYNPLRKLMWLCLFELTGETPPLELANEEGVRDLAAALDSAVQSELTRKAARQNHGEQKAPEKAKRILRDSVHVAAPKPGEEDHWRGYDEHFWNDESK